MSDPKSFEKKYPSLDNEAIEATIANQEKAKTVYAVDQAEVEKALTEYLQMQDQLKWEDPTGKIRVIAMVRRPSMKELKAMIPEGMRVYIDDPENVPKEVEEKYVSFMYEKMSELIAVPKLTAKQWEARANPWLVRLFWEHIANIAKLMEGQIEGF